MTQDWDQAQPAPDVMSDDKVLLKEAVDRIVQLNRNWAPEQILSGLMRRYWAEELPLFKLRASKECRFDPDENIRRLPENVTASSDPFWLIDIDECTVVADCDRFDWPREKLLYLLQGSPLSFVDKGFQANQAGFQAVARMTSVRAYGPKFECLTDLRTYAANLAAWCQREGLTCPPEWNSVPTSESKRYRSGAPGRPTSMQLVEAELDRADRQRSDLGEQATLGRGLGSVAARRSPKSAETDPEDDPEQASPKNADRPKLKYQADFGRLFRAVALP